MTQNRTPTPYTCSFNPDNLFYGVFADGWFQGIKADKDRIDAQYEEFKGAIRHGHGSVWNEFTIAEMESQYIEALAKAKVQS